MTDAYRLVQSGHVVARTEGDHALREIMFKTDAYDGPLAIQRRVNRRWREYGRIGYAE